MPSLPAGSPDAEMAVIATGNMGYGVNKKPAPYIPAAKGKKRSGIRKFEDELKDPVFDAGNSIRERG